MAIKVKKTTVSTTAVAITSADTDITNKGFVTLKNNSADKTCYIGPAGVTTATGFALAAGVTLANIELKNNETLFGICGAGDEAAIAALQTQY
jgi:hypothetical protein